MPRKSVILGWILIAVGWALGSIGGYRLSRDLPPPTGGFVKSTEETIDYLEVRNPGVAAKLYLGGALVFAGIVVLIKSRRRGKAFIQFDADTK